MRVLVTGARGFVGSSCLAPLLDRGYEVHAVVSHTSPAAPDDGAPGVTWHQADLLDDAQVSALIQLVRPSHLLHLAWVVTPGQFWTSPLNWPWVQASLHLLAAFGAHGGQRAVMTGTCAEYDWRTDRAAYDEMTTPLAPATVYGACKAALSLALPVFAAQAGVPSTAWARLFFLYGPREHPARLAPSAIQSLLRGEPFPCSHGRQLRDFMHVEDAAEAIVALLDSPVTGPVNIGMGKGVSLHQLLSRVGAEIGRADLLGFGARPVSSDEPRRLVASIGRLRNEVGWLPSRSLEDGVRHTVHWWREQGER